MLSVNGNFTFSAHVSWQLSHDHADKKGGLYVLYMPFYLYIYWDLWSHQFCRNLKAQLSSNIAKLETAAQLDFLYIILCPVFLIPYDADEQTNLFKMELVAQDIR